MSVETQTDRNVAAAGPSAPRRPIWLCADDYGISASVNRAIRDLVMRGRINATSVMVVAPSFHRSEAVSLNMLNVGARRVAIGLHVTLTAPFEPLSAGFLPLRGGAFLSKERDAGARLVAPAQAPCADGGGREPAQGVRQRVRPSARFHRRPPARPSVSAGARGGAGGGARDDAARLDPAVRPDAVPLGERFADRKGLLLDVLSHRMRTRASALGLATNPAFAGTYDFEAEVAPDFAKLFPAFLQRLPAQSVVMCHPGFVDAELERLDPLTTCASGSTRSSPTTHFPDLLQAHGVALA